MTTLRRRVVAAAVLAVAAGLALGLAAPALAADDCLSIRGDTFASRLKRVGCAAGYTRASDIDVADQRSIALTIGQFVLIAIGFVGVIFVVLIVYGGFLWMTAQGNEEQVTQSKTLIRNAVIGIIIVFSAFVITQALLLALGETIRAPITP